jgi:hypothetical protein
LLDFTLLYGLLEPVALAVHLEDVAMMFQTEFMDHVWTYGSIDDATEDGRGEGACGGLAVRIQSSQATQQAGLQDADGFRRGLFGVGSGLGWACASAK